MQILNITLHTPAAKDLVVVALMTLVASLVGTALMVASYFTLTNVFVLTIGIMSGSLAHAYGVSVKRHGWLGVALVSGFLLTLFGVAVLASYIVS
jgi:1,4-dihydroxy-2-naphthoate octaprenyltransferase